MKLTLNVIWKIINDGATEISGGLKSLMEVSKSMQQFISNLEVRRIRSVFLLTKMLRDFKSLQNTI